MSKKPFTHSLYIAILFLCVAPESFPASLDAEIVARDVTYKVLSERLKVFGYFTIAESRHGGKKIFGNNKLNVDMREFGGIEAEPLRQLDGKSNADVFFLVTKPFPYPRYGIDVVALVEIPKMRKPQDFSFVSIRSWESGQFRFDKRFADSIRLRVGATCSLLSRVDGTMAKEGPCGEGSPDQPIMSAEAIQALAVPPAPVVRPASSPSPRQLVQRQLEATNEDRRARRERREEEYRERQERARERATAR